MKRVLIFLPSLCFFQSAIRAQVPVADDAVLVKPQVVVTEPVVVAPAVTVRTLDPLAAQRQLLIAPKAVPVTGTTVVPVPAPEAPGVVKTTRTTTTVETPGLPPRVYQTERSVVVVKDQNESRELPYVALPVLFVRETAELLDAESRSAVEQMAGVIRTVLAAEPGAQFDIEGHTSVEGDPAFNNTLSMSRAQRIYDELTTRYAIPATALSAHGYGSSYAMYPNGTEPQLQMDRRVLVVRTR